MKRDNVEKEQCGAARIHCKYILTYLRCIPPYIYHSHTCILQESVRQPAIMLSTLFVTLLALLLFFKLKTESYFERTLR